MAKKRRRPPKAAEVLLIAQTATFHLALLQRAKQVLPPLVQGLANPAQREEQNEAIRSAARVEYFDWSMISFPVDIGRGAAEHVRRALSVDGVRDGWSKHLAGRRPTRAEVVKWACRKSAGLTVEPLWIHPVKDSAWLLVEGASRDVGVFRGWTDELPEAAQVEALTRQSSKGIRDGARVYAAHVLGVTEKTVREHMKDLDALRMRRFLERVREGVR